MSDVTFVTPFAEYHRDVVGRAIQSVDNQTVSCKHLVYEDKNGRGPAYWRNEGLYRTTTPFVVFLDADDWIASDFAERTLAAYRESGKYIYTDWYQDENVHPAPMKAWCNDTWHCLTALIPTEWAVNVNGFDETLPGAEDTDFYSRLCASNYGGARLAEPLFHYGKEGRRAWDLRESSHYLPVMRSIKKRYEGIMGCCGGYKSSDAAPVNAEFPEAIRARAMWGGNRQQRGVVSGILYPRAGNGRIMWVHQADVAAAGHLWQAVVEKPDEIYRNDHNHTDGSQVVPLADDVRSFDELRDVFAKRFTPPPPPTDIAPRATAETAASTPRVARVVELARRAYE